MSVIQKNRYVIALLLVILGILLVYAMVSLGIQNEDIFGDARAYWNTGEGRIEPYSLPPNSTNAYLYSPLFKQLISPLTLLPWPFFLMVWLTAALAAYVWLLKPLGWLWGSVALLWCIPEMVRGNIISFLAVSVVLGLGRFPVAWAFPILTKPVLGVGVFWFIYRREWRKTFIIFATTLGLVGLSYLYEPHLWTTWFNFLLDSSGNTMLFLPVRAVLAILLVLYAARTNRAWLVPFALLICTPVLGGYPTLLILAAVPRLVMQKRREDEEQVKVEPA